ncbi:DUF3309 family protein [Rhizobium sp. 11_C7_N12_5]|uniref:DUF3309 family protein n=1 Tax=Rhizobium TaxID=379 RepID=UPI003F21A96E
MLCSIADLQYLGDRQKPYSNEARGEPEEATHVSTIDSPEIVLILFLLFGGGGYYGYSRYGGRGLGGVGLLLIVVLVILLFGGHMGRF